MCVFSVIYYLFSVCVFQVFLRNGLDKHTNVSHELQPDWFNVWIFSTVIGAAEMDVSSFLGVVSRTLLLNRSDSFGFTQDHVYFISTCVLSYFKLIWQNVDESCWIWFQRCLTTGDQLNKNVLNRRKAKFSSYFCYFSIIFIFIFLF